VTRPRATPGAPPRPRKRLGQHFLHDARVLGDIVSALGDLGNRTVVEVGPGRGVLTDRLAAKAARVVAIELDRDLVPLLRERFAAQSHVEILEADALTVRYGEVAGGPYVLAGNVPYYITTPLLFHGLDAPRPDLAVYLVQREVAERAAAAPGSKVYGALSVNLQALASVTMIRLVPPGAFTPPPTVDSAVMTVRPRETPLVSAALEVRFRRFVLAAFGMRRKQMVRVLRSVAALSADESTALLQTCGIDPQARPETLSAEEFASVVTALK
jgi:16S rRNA (adenine1518-N6/adenine1519-N6)-dimethyltransferase